jgi:hypothetical protein
MEIYDYTIFKFDISDAVARARPRNWLGAGNK